MSKASPFPVPSSSRRPPNQSSNNNDLYYYNSSSSNSVLPLNINRPPSAASGRETPNSQRVSGGAGAPTRPARSDLRSRGGGGVLNSSASVPSVSQAQTQAQPRPSNSGSYNSYGSSYSGQEGYQYRDQEQYRNGVEPEPEPDTPKAVISAVSAFQSAGVNGRGRQRALTNGSSREKAREVPRKDRDRREERVKTNGNGKGKDYEKVMDLDGVLDRIKEEWSFVLEDDFNPVELALSLLDTSSVGRDLDSFRRIKFALERALKSTVDKHYQSFASSLPHHASLLSSLSTTQTQIIDTRARLVEVRDALGGKRADLVQLWGRGQSLDEMLRLLDDIETLKSIPDSLESLMSEKRLLQAAVLLVRNLKVINKADMLEVGAVADLRTYLVAQETAVRDILIEELHNHLFLKTFWCDSRWAPYVPGQDALPLLDSTPAERSSQPLALSAPPPSTTASRPPTKLSRFLDDLAMRPTLDPLLDLVPSPIATSPLAPSFDPSSFPPPTTTTTSQPQNPETDSFAYIETILESLAVLGQLGYALDLVAQRLPAEIHQLIDSTLDDVTERQELARRASSAVLSGRPSSVYVFATASVTGTKVSSGALRLSALESSEKETDHEILRDLFWTLYSKLDAVLQGMRVVYEVTNKIGSRWDFKDNSGARLGNLFPLADLYQPVLNEVRMLLHDNLTDEDRGSSAVNPIASMNEALRDGRALRDRNKAIFRFTESDSKASLRIIKRHEDELTRILRETVPGLMHAASDSIGQSPLSRVGNDDRFAGAEKHRLLLRPDAFHVSVLFRPTQAFLDRVGEVLPAVVYDVFKDESALLDDFVLNVYLPQLEEKVSALVHQAISGPDAFEEDPLSLRISPKPLVKACTQLMALINSLCAMLRTTPFHRENYSRLILSVIIHFYQRCNSRFQNLVARSSLGVVPDVVPDAMLRTSARWAQRAEVSACLTELYSMPEGDTDRKRNLCQQETRVELSFLSNYTVAKDDLIPLRDLAELCRLHHSLTWFIQQLAALRVLAEDPISPTSADPLASYFSPAKPSFQPWQAIETRLSDDQLRLPLTRAMALRFDALLKTYDLLAEVVLCTARIDTRCRTICYLELDMRLGDFMIEHEPFEPDLPVVELNSELGKIDDLAANTLPEREQRFLFEGLGSLIDQLLVSGARHINLTNVHGVEKVMRNLLALEQNLKAMNGDAARDADLRRARKYWGLFLKGPKAMLEDIQKNRPQFSFDEYKAMLSLQCGVDQSQVSPPAPGGGRASSLSSARSSMAENPDRRAYNEYVIELHALAIEDW